jgi:ABC-2 type transport system permease protein
MHRLTKLTLTEAKLFLRDPTAVFFTVVFPPLLLGILGAIPAFRQPSEDLGGQRAFVLAILALSVVPTYLATYREKGILRRLATTPVRPSGLLLAQLAIGLGMALAAVTLVLGVGVVAFDTALPE